MGKMPSANHIAGFFEIKYLNQVNDGVYFLSPEKYGDEVDFLPADRDESFLLVDNITLDMRSQVCPKYPK